MLVRGTRTYTTGCRDKDCDALQVGQQQANMYMDLYACALMTQKGMPEYMRCDSLVELF